MRSLADALPSLRAHFGFDDFREGQRDVIQAILQGKDVVVVMPTGSGKSLCYQLPALMSGGATLVVSPLIALMKDQVDGLQARGLPATFINSSIPEIEQRNRIDALRRGQFKLVYVAPERFRSGRFVTALQSLKVSLFAIDEAHCISTWGHDFRPDYLRLKNVITSLGKVQTLALTATATPYVRADIIQQLGLNKPETFVSGFDRPNLSIDVTHTERVREKLDHIGRIARKLEGSGIVYASTRKAVEEVSRELRDRNLNVAAYHAGMKDPVRLKAQQDFMWVRKQIIVATNAFGMGIDKPDIRVVVHYQMPGSIEAYYQEIGRAGRDGLPASCHLLFNYVDKNTHDFFIEGSYPDLNVIKVIYDTLVSTGLQRIELSSSEIARRALVKNEMAVQSSLYLLERAGHIERTALPDSRFQVDASNDSRSRRNRTIIMLDNPPVTRLRIEPRDISRRADLERRKLREMIEFCYTDRCYRAHILDYFGDRHHSRNCGTCGNCAPRKYAVQVEPGEDVFFHPRRLSKATVLAPPALVVRALTTEELLRIRKILACAKRMKGRFGKKILIGTIRGSAAKNVMKANLNALSTYGLLKDVSQYLVELYVESLIRAGCLIVSKGEYPTVGITELGERIMREQATIELLLPTNE